MKKHLCFTGASLSFVCFLFFSSCAVHSTRAWRGSLDVSQKVDTAAAAKYKTIVVRYTVKDPELKKFIRPIHTELSQALPKQTHYAKIFSAAQARQVASVEKALTLYIEPIKFTGHNVIQMGNEGLSMKVSLVDESSKTTLGKAEILAPAKDDETSIGGAASFKVSGYDAEELVVAKRTAKHIVAFLKGDK